MSWNLRNACTATKRALSNPLTTTALLAVIIALLLRTPRPEFDYLLWTVEFGRSVVLVEPLTGEQFVQPAGTPCRVLTSSLDRRVVLTKNNRVGIVTWSDIIADNAENRKFIETYK